MENISKTLIAGKYNFTLSKEVLILKLGKTEKRLLRIASLREKLVQKAIQQVMELYFILKFSEYSHGFILSRGVQTAMMNIDAQFQSVR